MKKLLLCLLVLAGCAGDEEVKTIPMPTTGCEWIETGQERDERVYWFTQWVGKVPIHHYRTERQQLYTVRCEKQSWLSLRR